MTLQEIVYQIDGKLELKYNQVDNTCTAKLLDKTGEPAWVKMAFGQKVKKVEACATGTSVPGAKDNLVKLLRNNILEHNWPIMWTSSSAFLRVPDSLVVYDHANFVSAD